MTKAKVILITGTSSGIGKTTATLLAREGHRVYGGSRTEHTPIDFTSLILDVTSGSSVDAAVRKIMQLEGRIDVLINNAGIGMVSSAEEAPIASVRQVMETNFTGMVRMTQKILPHMRSQKKGMIINISSIAGISGLPYRSIYSASKFAVEGFTEALRMEVHKYGIEVCTLQLGSVYTPIRQKREDELHESSVYFQEGSRVKSQFNQEVENGLDPETIGKKIVQIVRKEKLRPKYLVANIYQKTFSFLIRPLPCSFIEWLVNTHYRITSFASASETTKILPPTNTEPEGPTDSRA